MRNQTTRLMMHLTFLILLIIVMSLTPLGFIQIGLIRATLIHIPVIFGSLMYGWKMGAALGFAFGMMSFINNTMVPTPLSFAFSPLIPVIGTDKGSVWALVIAFVPRILVGIVPYFVLNKTKKASLAALFGSLTNTVLVMGLIGFVFKDAYAQVMNIDVSPVYKVILGIVFTNGLAEAVVSTLILTPVYNRLKKS